MNKEQQVKTIMEIFDGLSNEDQVSLFKEVKSCLLNLRKQRAEVLSTQSAEIECAHKSLIEGTNEILSLPKQ